MKDKDKLVPPAPAATVKIAAHALRSCWQATLLGGHASREHREQAEWAIKYLCVCAAMTLTDEERARAVAVIHELPPGQCTIEAFASACEREPSLADFGSAIKARWCAFMVFLVHC